MRIIRYATLLLVFTLVGCDDDNGFIELRNQSGRAISEVTIDPCGAENPGPNRLNGGEIPDGEVESFQLDLGCYQVSILTEDGFPGFWQVDLNRSGRRVVLFAEPPQVD